MGSFVRRGVVTLAQHRPLITFPMRIPLVPVIPPKVPVPPSSAASQVCAMYERLSNFTAILLQT